MSLTPRGQLPYEQFEGPRSPLDAHLDQKLEDLYHRGQKKAWDGRAVLEQLLADHGPVQLDPERTRALGNIFSIIYWGELAAWKVSAALAEQLESPEAAMAATAQAHDEARHFTVMRAYMEALGHPPGRVPPVAESILVEVLETKDLTRKLLGMQLMVEPIALTIFQLVRKAQVEPVLCHLLPYFERDEARHVALGVVHLPRLLENYSRRDLARLFAWQIKMYMRQIDGVLELEDDVKALGFTMRETFYLGQKLQFQAANELMEAMGGNLHGQEILAHIIEARLAWDCPLPGDPLDLPHRLGRMAHCLLRGPEPQRRAELFGRAA